MIGTLSALSMQKHVNQFARFSGRKSYRNECANLGFKDGDVSDLERSGDPLKSRLEDLQALLDEDASQTQKEFAEQHGLSQKTTNILFSKNVILKNN